MSNKKVGHLKNFIFKKKAFKKKNISTLASFKWLFIHYALIVILHMVLYTDRPAAL